MSNALCRMVVKPQEWRFAHLKRKVPCHVIFVVARGACRDVVHLEPNTWVRTTVILKSLGYLIVLRCR
jgi:hypothetical protein